METLYTCNYIDPIIRLKYPCLILDALSCVLPQLWLCDSFWFYFHFFDIVASNITVVKEVEAIMDPAAFTVVRFVVSAIPFLSFALQA